MAAGTAGITRDTQTRFKVNHARQVVDQVALLRERVKRQEKAIETVITERDLAIECCDRQKILIAQLLKKVKDANLARATVSEQESESVPRDIADTGHASDNTYNLDSASARGGQFGRQEPGKTTLRVNSMRAALLRIGGVEVVDNEQQQDSRDEDLFDASEFQPIADDENVLVKAKDLIASGFARVSPFKRDIAAIESEGLQTSR